MKQTLQDDLDVVNRFFVKYTGTAPSVLDLESFLDAVITAWGTNVSPLQSAAAVLVEALAEDLTSATSAVASQAASAAGTRSGAPLTGAVAAVINHQIARRYRGGHPKTFLFAGIETDIATVGTWKPAFLTEVGDAWAAFQAAVEVATWTGATLLQIANVSFYEGFHNFTYPSGRTRPIPTIRVTPLIDVISGLVVRQIIGSQRRRNQ
jgi:hypothetical protein